MSEYILRKTTLVTHEIRSEIDDDDTSSDDLRNAMNILGQMHGFKTTTSKQTVLIEVLEDEGAGSRLVGKWYV